MTAPSLRERASEATALTRAQMVSLRDLGEPYHFRVNWRPALSNKAYRDLLERGFITEAWTWASTTRPDVAVTDAGHAARSLAKDPTP